MTSAPTNSITSLDGHDAASRSIAPIVRDYAFSGPLALGASEVGAPFQVRSSAYVASPVGYEHGHPGPLLISAGLEDVPSYEAATGTPGRPAYTSKEMSDVWQLAQDGQGAADDAQNEPERTHKEARWKKWAACAVALHILMVLNGACVLAMLCAAEKMESMDDRDPFTSTRATVAVASGVLTAVPSSLFVFLALCAFRGGAEKEDGCI